MKRFKPILSIPVVYRNLFHPLKASTVTISLAESTIDYGDDAVITVSIPQYATGLVECIIGNEYYSKQLISTAGSNAVFTVSGLTSGTKPIVINYLGNNEYGSCNGSSTITVRSNAPVISVNDVCVGDAVPFTVSVRAEGTVSVEILDWDDNVVYQRNLTLNNGVASDSVIGLDASTIAQDDVDESYTITATYESQEVSDTFKVISNLIVYGAEKLSNGTLQYTSEYDDDFYVRIISKWPDDHGACVFGINGSTYTVSSVYRNGKGYCYDLTSSIMELGVGTYAITFQDSVTGEILEFSLVVEGLESFLIINASNIVFSENEVITCITPSDATGTISLIVSGIEPTSGSNMYTSQTSSGGTATFIIENLQAGSYNATGTYAGNSKYKSSTDTTIFEVSKLIIDSDEIKVIDYGNGTIIVSMPEENVTGTLSVKYQGNTIQTETLEDGACVFDLNGLLPSGEIDIDIYYPGDSNYSSATRSETINMPNNNTPI